MTGGYHSIESILTYLAEIGALGPALRMILAMLVMGGLVLLAVWLHGERKRFRMGGGMQGVRTRQKVKFLRARGKLQEEFSFADAVELHDTGTIRRKTIEDKIVACVETCYTLFNSAEHHPLYMVENAAYARKEMKAWVDAAQALKLPDISRMFEEILAMRDVVMHPDFSSEFRLRGENLYDNMCERAQEMYHEFTRSDGHARLRSAAEDYLRRNAPDRLPFSTS